MSNPWRTIWREPRATIQRIVETDPEKHVVAIAAILGVAQVLDRASMRNAGDHFGLGTILISALVLGPIFGVVGLYLWSALLRWTGRWIGGQGSAPGIRAAIAWGTVPTMVASALWIPELLMAGKDLFTSSTPRLDANPSLALAMMPMFAVEFAAAIWSMVLIFKCLGQVQGFSAWKALGNSVLAFLAIVIPVAILAFLIAMLTR